MNTLVEQTLAMDVVVFSGLVIGGIILLTPMLYGVLIIYANYLGKRDQQKAEKRFERWKRSIS